MKFGRQPTDKELIELNTQEEWDYYKRKNIEVPPEQRYRHKKKTWYFHTSSWYMRKPDGYDGKGCNQFTGCIPECRYYPKDGRIDDKEVLS
jgi:hypothetical protein